MASIKHSTADLPSNHCLDYKAITAFKFVDPSFSQKFGKFQNIPDTVGRFKKDVHQYMYIQ